MDISVAICHALAVSSQHLDRVDISRRAEGLIMLRNPRCLLVILIGVSGAGKTTVARLLAQDLGWPFYDGDDFHSQTNIEKMQRGVALTAEDRSPWLAQLRTLLSERLQTNQPAVVACSALKYAYRSNLLLIQMLFRLCTYAGPISKSVSGSKKGKDSLCR